LGFQPRRSDNRRLPDYAERQRLLASLTPEVPLASLVEHWRDGRIKMALIHNLLDLRRRHPALFAQGNYTAVSVSGALAECVVAFERTTADASLLVVVPRFISRVGFPPLGERWGDTALELSTAREWVNVLTGRPHSTRAKLPISEISQTSPSPCSRRCSRFSESGILTTDCPHCTLGVFGFTDGHGWAILPSVEEAVGAKGAATFLSPTHLARRASLFHEIGKSPPPPQRMTLLRSGPWVGDRNVAAPTHPRTTLHLVPSLRSSAISSCLGVLVVKFLSAEMLRRTQTPVAAEPLHVNPAASPYRSPPGTAWQAGRSAPQSPSGFGPSPAAARRGWRARFEDGDADDVSACSFQKDFKMSPTQRLRFRQPVRRLQESCEVVEVDGHIRMFLP